MDGELDIRSCPRLHCKHGSYYHVFRGTWRWLATASEADLALARYRKMEAVLEDLEARLDGAAGEWAATRERRPRGIRRPQRERPYPPRMHEKDGRLYHVFRQKWRPLGPASDFPGAMEAYWRLERDIVTPAKRARHGMRQRADDQRRFTLEPSPSLRLEPSPNPAVAGCAPPPGWNGYYGGGTPAGQGSAAELGS
ncbi:MAG TPA: hypothetical protein VK973_13255 [Arenicellales bacterium]|nr:hypothetical protein [Arenicellales bacterium]